MHVLCSCGSLQRVCMQCLPREITQPKSSQQEIGVTPAAASSVLQKETFVPGELV